MNHKEFLGILSRYFILLLLTFLNIKYDLLYSIFTPLTVVPVFEILNKLYFAQLIGSYYNCPDGNASAIFVKGYYACIIDACVAGAAYFFLLILNLSTPMRVAKRVKSIVFMMVTFLALNVIRIIIFIILVTVGYKYFDFVHELTWMFASTLLVVCVWFANVWLFEIKSIPGYTDLYVIWQDVLGRKGRRKDGHN